MAQETKGKEHGKQEKESSQKYMIHSYFRQQFKLLSLKMEITPT